jgi:hypothetical protein
MRQTHRRRPQITALAFEQPLLKANAACLPRHCLSLCRRASSGGPSTSAAIEYTKLDGYPELAQIYLAKSEEDMEALHEAATGLHEAGGMDKLTMRRFDLLCLITGVRLKREQIQLVIYL